MARHAGISRPPGTAHQGLPKSFKRQRGVSNGSVPEGCRRVSQPATQAGWRPRASFNPCVASSLARRRSPKIAPRRDCSVAYRARLFSRLFIFPRSDPLNREVQIHHNYDPNRLDPALRKKLDECELLSRRITSETFRGRPRVARIPGLYRTSPFREVAPGKARGRGRASRSCLPALLRRLVGAPRLLAMLEMSRGAHPAPSESGSNRS